ncbi:hypothetical protein L6164_017799 [Bauhinia variegata]|uniref:Uncharacterized protein n=1 Tax=Bauhinia variegata TaxID=167791 RepID=A0ACB9N997_BAUVA|nr:hypothetical protein L6164_017799 [Bauhinia variegata]
MENSVPSVANFFSSSDVEAHRQEFKEWPASLQGKEAFGPFWSHIVGYWKESTENPNKVLFLKYEDLKEDLIYQIKMLAEFIGFPFSLEEQRQGVVEDISKLCTLNVLMDLEVNQNGKYATLFPKKSFYRKGEVGDWINHINKMIEEKCKDSGLTFELPS